MSKEEKCNPCEHVNKSVNKEIPKLVEDIQISQEGIFEKVNRLFTRIECVSNTPTPKERGEKNQQEINTQLGEQLNIILHKNESINEDLDSMIERLEI